MLLPQVLKISLTFNLIDLYHYLNQIEEVSMKFTIRDIFLLNYWCRCICTISNTDLFAFFKSFWYAI